MRNVLLELTLHGRRENATAGTDPEQTRQVIGVGSIGEGVGEWPSHRVADEGDAHDAFAFGERPHCMRVEAMLGVEHHPGTGEQQVAHAPLRGAVHERSDDQTRQRKVGRE